MSWFEVPLGILVVNSLREGENGRGYIANTISQFDADFFEIIIMNLKMNGRG